MSLKPTHADLKHVLRVQPSGINVAPGTCTISFFTKQVYYDDFFQPTEELSGAASAGIINFGGNIRKMFTFARTAIRSQR